MYGVTDSKIVHVIGENARNGECGYWFTICGKWIRPKDVSDTKPGGCRMCKACAKKEATR